MTDEITYMDCSECCFNVDISPICKECTWDSDHHPTRFTRRTKSEEPPAKADAGKLELDLVPRQIIRDIAEVRAYGTAKYHDPNNWQRVELRRYVNALLRHTLAYLDDPDGVDEESGLPHYKHMACNMAFICEMQKERDNGN